MKANELMIGDYVLYQGNPNRVYRILPDTVPFADAGRMKEDLVHIVWHDVHKQVNVRKIDPVPLTPEILEKNGYKLIGEKFVFGEIDDDLVELNLSINNSYRVKISVADLMISHSGWIKYVHELQHALRLCGIEKEIEL